MELGDINYTAGETTDPYDMIKAFGLDTLFSGIDKKPDTRPRVTDASSPTADDAPFGQTLSFPPQTPSVSSGTTRTSHSSDTGQARQTAGSAPFGLVTLDVFGKPLPGFEWTREKAGYLLNGHGGLSRASGSSSPFGLTVSDAAPFENPGNPSYGTSNSLNPADDRGTAFNDADPWATSFGPPLKGFEWARTLKNGRLPSNVGFSANADASSVSDPTAKPTDNTGQAGAWKPLPGPSGGGKMNDTSQYLYAGIAQGLGKAYRKGRPIQLLSSRYPTRQDAVNRYSCPAPRGLDDLDKKTPLRQVTVTPVSETEMLYQTGQSAHNALFGHFIPDAAVGTVATVGRLFKDAADLTAFLTNDRYGRDFSTHMDKGIDRFIGHSGSDLLNKQRNNIAAVQADPKATAGDVMRVLINNPYAALFDLGIEIGSLMTPLGELKVGSYLTTKVPRIARNVYKYFPYARQAFQNMGRSFAATEGEDTETRYRKAAAAGTISLIAGLFTRAGAAGEYARRLSNSTVGEPLYTALNWSRAAGNQGILGASTAAGTSVAHDINDGRHPDLNRVGKEATYGAISGAAGGGFWHPFHTPTQRKALRVLRQIDSNHPRAHTLDRHGPGTTRKQQLIRATQGLTPEGFRQSPRDASRWYNNIYMYDAYTAAFKKWKAARLADEENQPITVVFDKNIGEGYLKNTNKLIKTNKAIFRFNENGDLITAYPLIGEPKAPVTTQP